MHSSPTGRPQGRDSAAAEPRRHEHRRRGAPPAPRATPRRHRPRRARRRRPRLQRGDRPRAVGPAPRRAPGHALPLQLPDHGRRQRQHRRHAHDRAGAGRGDPGRRVGPARGEGPRQGAADGLGRLGRGRARLLRRRPLDRPRRAAPPRRPADLRALGPRDRHPARPGLTGGPRTEAGVHLALLQPAAARHPADRLHRRPVRLQGDPRGRREAVAAAGRGHRLVLRHRDAGARRALRSADPRGPGRLGRRPGFARRHRRHRRGRPARDLAGRARARIGNAPGRRAPRPARPRTTRPERPLSADRHATPARPLRGHRCREHDRAPAAVPAVPRRDGGDRGERRRAAPHEHRQHRREPPADLRRAWRRRCRAAPVPGPDHLRARAGADDGCARAPRTPRARREPGRRAGRHRRRQRRRHRAAVRPVPRVGLPPAPRHCRGDPAHLGEPGMTATLSASASDPAAPTPVPTAAAPLRPRWELPSLAVLLIGTAAFYLWNLSASVWANSFYAAAVQAGTQNWTAFFFGSLDSANAITVDKPPAALWVMALSGRIFGFSSWSMLAPQALMAVGAVALLWATVRRVAGPAAGLLAGTLLALTPVAVLMFEFNNPDALLVLLMVAAAWATTRAVEKASTTWLLLAGVFIGFGFLTKMLQAFLVVPGLAAAYLWAAPTTLWRRVRQLLAAGVAIVVSAGWWLVAVALWPVDSRPYIGGSTDNSPLELAFGYNGLGRIFGGQGNGGGRRGAELPGGLPGGTEAAVGGVPPRGGGDGGL